MIRNINEEFQDLEDMLHLGFRWSILLSSLFWSFCLFDTLGDAVGVRKAYWIIIVIVFCPVFLLHLSDYLLMSKTFNQGDQQSTQISEHNRGNRVDGCRGSDSPSID
jgi:hypothetical protein